jgi:ATP-dependent DNA helicase DinG
VDAPGEALKVVLICRLPFSVPTDPVIKARMEAIEKRGGNSFMEYALPQAAMKLRQGFGRLMRRKSDRGIVCILDSRIIRKSYGKVMLETLPETAMRIKGREELLRELEDFLWTEERHRA